MKKIIAGLLIGVSLLAGCSKENGGEEQGTSKTIGGTVQKGPFVTGTSIKVQMLDNGLNPTGSSMETQITDDFGRFTVTGKVEGDFAEIIGTGYYFNEVANHLSNSTLVLRGLTQIEATGKANLNILTTLQAPRVKKLMGEGKSFAAAVIQSQTEILNAFGIELNGCPAFGELNIAEQGDANAVLLAVSAIMQADRSVAELTELIAKVANDLADNGKIDNATLVDAIRSGHMAVDPDAVRSNLMSYYADRGQNVTIPDLSDYLDSDGNGNLNKDETEMNFSLSLVYDSANGTRASNPGTPDITGTPYDNLTDLTVLVFDEQGKNIFVQRDASPLIEDGSYGFSFTPKNGQRVLENSTIYALLNCPTDYSGFTKTESEFIADNIILDLTQTIETGLKSGKLTAKLTTTKENVLTIPVQVPYAKVCVEVDFADDVPADKRTINSVSLLGAYSQGAVFDTEKDDFNVADILLTKSENAYEAWVFNNSPLNLTITTTGGVYNIEMLDGTAVPIVAAKRGIVYECRITLTSREGEGQTYQATFTVRPIYAQQTTPEL